MYLGDFKEDGDIFFKFTTRKFSTGAPFTLANTPVLSVYVDEADGTEKTTGENYFDLDVDFDSKTGLNNVRIDLSGDAFFATGADYTVVITTGTVDSVSVIGEVVATFSIENRSMGQPVGATLSDDIAAIKAETVSILADTDDIGVAGAGLSDLGGMSTGMKAEVESEANDALVALKLDHLVAVADGDDPVNNSIIAKLADSGATADWSAYVNTTDALRALRDRGDAAWVTATGFNTTVPDAAGVAPTAVEVREEMDSNSTQLSTLITGVVVASIDTDAIDAVAVDADVWAEILDLANGIDTDITIRQFGRLASAALFGKASGLGTTNALYRNIPDDVNAIDATVDADGNRSAVSLNKT